MSNININILAKSTFAIIAVVAVIAMAGFISTGIGSLLQAAQNIVMWLVLGSVLIALLIHGPRFLK